MSLIRWQDCFTIGVSFIDADHQVVVSLLNQLYDAREEGQTREVVGSVLNVLIEYTINHFRREERLMEFADYPDLSAHKEQHNCLAGQVRLFQQQYDDGRHAAVDELLDFLKNWLVEHIIGEDTRIWPWVDRAQPTAEELFDIAHLPLEGDQ
jgi:hemerythrin